MQKKSPIKLKCKQTNKTWEIPVFAKVTKRLELKKNIINAKVASTGSLHTKQKNEVFH